MRVFLIGFMASGKTTVGRRLARILGVRFVDLDTEIEERAGVPLREIFDSRGEPAFRSLERDLLLEAVTRETQAVVATGGGTATVPANRELIRESGVSVWLDPPLATVLERLAEQGEDRPLFRDADQAARLYRQRLSSYRDCDIRIGVAAGDGPEQVAARIVERLQEHSCVT